MDLSALYLHIASELGTNVAVYSKNSLFSSSYSKRKDLLDPIRDMPEIHHFLFSEEASCAPVLSSINHTITYALVDSTDARYLIGPVLTEPSAGILRHFDYPECPDGFSAILNPCPIHTLVSHILLLHDFLNPPGISSLEFFNLRFSCQSIEDTVRKKTTLELFGRREYGEMHNSLSNELRLLESIEQGNLSALRSCWAEEYSGKLGVTAKDPYRSGKNLAIGTIVLASRAAIRGGLHYETAFSMCDSYEMQIEELNDMTKLESLVQNAEYTFTVLVRDIQNAKSAPSAAAF